jgi:hypothetical protein
MSARFMDARPRKKHLSRWIPAVVLVAVIVIVAVVYSKGRNIIHVDLLRLRAEVNKTGPHESWWYYGTAGGFHYLANCGEGTGVATTQCLP